jgi:transposase
MAPNHGQVSLSAIRSPVVGRKNHYGSRSCRGTEVAAIFYSLVETAKLHSLDPAKDWPESVRAPHARIPRR